MIVTIDNAGRLVVPKPLRDQFNLTPGCELEIEAGVDGITLRRADAEPALVRKERVDQILTCSEVGPVQNDREMPRTVAWLR